jgi:hypothetical protein
MQPCKHYNLSEYQVVHIPTGTLIRRSEQRIRPWFRHLIHHQAPELVDLSYTAYLCSNPPNCIAQHVHLHEPVCIHQNTDLDPAEYSPVPFRLHHSKSIRQHPRALDSEEFHNKVQSDRRTELGSFVNSM